MISTSGKLVLLLTLFIAKSAFANICDFCDCQPSRNEVFSVTCSCDQIKNLYFTPKTMQGAESASMVVIKNCHMVNIQQNSFTHLDKLDTLAIQSTLFVSLSAGAFGNLNSLLINNVQDISFKEMALMGARGIKNIIINTSNITQLPKYSLYDIEGLERFTLGNVSIGQIFNDAVNISARNVVLQNVKINQIESNGLALKAQKVLIKNSDFYNPAINSISTESDFQTRFLNNRFGNVFQMDVTSPFAEFSGNYFENFHSASFKNIQMSRVMNNTILRIDSYSSFKNFDFKDFFDNYFVCNCGMNLLQSFKRYDNYDIFKNNFCLANCSLNLFEFEVESMARCNMRNPQVDVNSLCTYERTVRHNNRQHRRLNVNNENGVDDKNISMGKFEPRFLIGDDDGSVNSTSPSKGFSVKTYSSLFLFNFLAFLLMH